MTSESTNRLAVSRAGHDRGTLYLVLSEGPEGLLLADGKRRKLNRPKQKNQKHVEFLPDIDSSTVSGLLREPMTDAAVRRALAALRRHRSEAE